MGEIPQTQVLLRMFEEQGLVTSPCKLGLEFLPSMCPNDKSYLNVDRVQAKFQSKERGKLIFI